MKNRGFCCVLWALALLLAPVGCSIPLRRATPTATTVQPTLLPTSTPVPSATARPSPTLPSLPQLVGEIRLGGLPGSGHNPQALTVLNGRVYVANRDTDNVSVISGDAVSAVIEVGDAPVAIAADERSGFVFVANEGDDSISMISGDRVVRTVAGPPDPACLAAWDGRLYAGGRADNTLLVLDGGSGEQLAAVPLQAPIGILALAVNPSLSLLYASVYNGVEIIDLQKLAVVGRLERETYLTLGADPASGRFFISEYEAASGKQYLMAYDALGQRLLGRAPLGGDPRGMAVDAVAGRIYVANSWSNDLSIIDSESLQTVATVSVGLQPMAVAVAGSGRIYVANSGSHNVAVLDAQNNRLLQVIPLAILPRGMAVDAATGRLYVACASTNSVLVVEDGRVVAEMAAGLHPAEIALAADGQTLSVLNYVSGDLMAISTREGSVLKSVQVGPRPRGLALVPEMDQLYVGDAVLDAQEQSPLRQVKLLTIYGAEVNPVEIQVDAKAARAYMLASNGVPGSNGGVIVYVVDLKTGQQMQGEVGGLSMTGLALDPQSGRIYSTAGRFGYFQLIVNEATNLKRVATLGLPKYPAAMGYNSQTFHLFIYLTQTSNPTITPGSELWVLDSRGLGTVVKIPVAPDTDSYDPNLYELAVDGARGRVFLADGSRGTVWVFQDVALPPAPTPVPTSTPTPWPTLPPEPMPTTTPDVVRGCERSVSPPFETYWSGDLGLRWFLRCPLEDPQTGFVTEQPFERGIMLWREADRTILVLYEDGVWRSFPDRWAENMSELSCGASPPGALLQPKRGFGWVWCMEKGVKEGLGWATDEEAGAVQSWQPFEGGQMLALSTRGVLYALLYDGTFRQYATQ